MINKLIISTYIIGALLFAAFAHAQTSQLVPVTSAQFDPQLSQMHISGYLANSCQANPQPVVAQVKDHVVFLKVVSAVPAQVLCAQVISGQYELAFDIRSLGLPDGNYTFKIINAGNLSSINVSVLGQTDGFQFSSKNIAGQIQLADTNGTLVIATANREVYEVRSTDALDLTQYIGMNVNVSGHEFVNQIDPVAANTDDNVLAIYKGKRGGLFVVTGISVYAK